MAYPVQPCGVYYHYHSMKLPGWPQNLLCRGICALLMLLVFAALPLAADDQTPSPVSRYLAARQQLDPVTNLPPQALASLDPSLSGLALELRGQIVAIVTPTQDAMDAPARRILLQTDSGVTVALDYRQSDMELAVGERVAVLARVPEDPQDCEHLQVEQIIAERRLPGGSTAEEGTGAGRPPQSPMPSTTPTTGAVDIPQPPQSVHTDLYDPQRIQIWQEWIAKHNPDLSKIQRERIVEWVLYHCDHTDPEYYVDHRLIFSVILAESNFDPNCRSRAGAQGLMQLMPGTAQRLGVTNAYYLAKYLRQFRGETNYRQCALALACYNAGPNAVKQYGGVPPFPETRRYVIKVTQQFHDLYHAGYP